MITELPVHLPLDVLHASVMTLLIGGRSSFADVLQLGRYLVVGALATALAIQITLVGAESIRGHHPDPALTAIALVPAAALPARRAPYDLPALLSTNLFGAAADAGAPTTEATDWDLLGVIAADGGDHGIAILAQKGQSAHVYVVGDHPVEGATLAKVMPDRVLLSWANRNEEVLLPHLRATANADVPVRLAQRSGAEPAPDSPRVAEAKKQLQGVRDFEPHPVFAARPVFQNGQVSGLMVAPAGNSEAFAGLGLRPRDIITRVNGSDAIGAASGVTLARSLESGTPVTVTVMRNGRQIELSLASVQNR